MKYENEPNNQRMCERMNATNYERTEVQMYEIRKRSKQPTNQLIYEPINQRYELLGLRTKESDSTGSLLY